VYLLEGFYVLPTRKSAKFHEILRKFEPKLLITLLVKKVNTPKGKYLGKYLFTFGIRFLLEPYEGGIFCINSRCAAAAIYRLCWCA